ncbi:MAG: gluconate 2-dehydrogenase subunit 3 family protein [Gemmatimonadota bacterium]
MTEPTRREILGLMALTPLTALNWKPESIVRARDFVTGVRKTAAETGLPYEPAFFTAHEYATVSALADLIIPRDERSGSATESGAPEFMDFMLNDRPDSQVAVRGGLAWIDNECHHRFGKAFVDSTPAERASLADDLAWPEKARPELSHGVAFFSRFRDMTASAFFSSKLGVEDLQYKGNTFVTEWNGCPPEALAKLGVSYS